MGDDGVSFSVKEASLCKDLEKRIKNLNATVGFFFNTVIIKRCFFHIRGECAWKQVWDLKQNNLQWICPLIPHYYIPPWLHLGGRHWLREAAEETHLPSLPALPQECFSSGPLSPMCRRPLCRVCFACKAGCRCCPQKATRRDGGEGGGGCEDTRRPRRRATRLASPRFAATPSAAPCPQHLSLLYPLKAPPSTPTPHPHPLSISSLTCHPSLPSPSHPTIPLPPSLHTQLCVSWETCFWLVYGGTLGLDRHNTRTHTHHTTSMDRKSWQTAFGQRER